MTLLGRGLTRHKRIRKNSYEHKGNRARNKKDKVT